MPVRDLDTFLPAGGPPLRCLANRGASGIDGVVSSALGVSAVADGPLVLVVGDISLYHDANGLLAARQHQLNATIVLLNNDGGGIFSFLSQASQPEHFETLFGTPHGLDFQPLVALYGGTLRRPETWSEFRCAVGASLSEGGLQVVEVRTERQRNVTLHRQIWDAVSRALERELE
jgi:2-succinyl-5-enolpyruvyl-6-hydroxy-3-cyclohexene-1-carboxylate synthase